jgi:subtilisin family serine protease
LGSKIIIWTDVYGDGEGVKDRNGHGIHIAGITSASTNNSCGIAGVAPNCKLLIYQVFSETGSGSLQAFYSAVVAATDYKISNSGKKVVINFSGGGPSPSSYFTTAIEYARQNDIPIIIAAGNFDGDLEVQYPAKYSVNYNNVIAVSSTDRIDKRVNT